MAETEDHRATNGDQFGNYSESESSDAEDEGDMQEHLGQQPLRPEQPRTIMRKTTSAPSVSRPDLPEQPQAESIDWTKTTAVSPEIIARQATINIGTIGHVAHGKSTVVRAISGVQTVRFKNELERNITIKLGYANAKIYRCENPECPRPQCYKSYGSEQEVSPPCPREGCGGTMKLLRHVSFVDCPGHDILMSTMLSGAAVMDAAILLIAGNESCPQPQTSEHLAAIEIMKLENVVILQNKVDLLREANAAEHHTQITKFVRGTVAQKSPIVPVSAQLRLGIDAVLENLCSIPVPIRNFTETPRLLVIRSFDVNKPGSSIEELVGGVAGGSVLTGVFKLGSEIQLSPGIVTKDDEGKIICRPIFSRIVSLFAEHNNLQFAVPGGLIGVGTRIDPTLCRADRLVGHQLGLRGQLPSIYIDLEINYYLLKRLLGVRSLDGKMAKVTKLTKGETLMVNIGSTATGGKVIAVKSDAARITLTSPACTGMHKFFDPGSGLLTNEYLEIGEKIALSRRIDKHWRLIGWANIVSGTTIEPQAD